MLSCSACGTDNNDDQNFCGKCGTSLRGEGTGKLNPDTVLEGRYVIVKTVGQGGMGSVYLALDTRLNNMPVAIKEMSTRAIGGDLQAAIAGFKKEASLLISLKHNALPVIRDFFSKGDSRWYLVMDYIEGHTLKDEVQQRGPIPETEVNNWAMQLCDILDFLHKRNPPIIFRDLKPDNIMLTPDRQIKLIDFGIARHFQKGSTADTAAYGSSGFAPPEQYGENQTDPRSDIYALGATLHYLLTGIDPSKNPFNFDPPSMSNKVSNRMEKAIMKALELKAVNRPQSIDEFKTLLPQRIIKTSPQQETQSNETKPLVSEPTGSKFNEAATTPLRMDGVSGTGVKGTGLLTPKNEEQLNATVPAAKMNAAINKTAYVTAPGKLPGNSTQNNKARSGNWIALTMVLAIALLIGGVLWANRANNEQFSSNINDESEMVTQNESNDQLYDSGSVDSNNQSEPEDENSINESAEKETENDTDVSTPTNMLDQNQIMHKGDLKEGLRWVILRDQSWAYINAKGEIVIGPFWGIAARDFSEGLAAAAETFGKWKYYDKRGNIAFTVDCSDAYDFHDGLARLWTNGNVAYVDRTGRYVIKLPDNYQGEDFSNGLARVWDGNENKYGYIDKTGQIVKWE